MAHTARPTMSRDPSFQPHTSAKKNISSPTPLSPSTNAKTPMAPPPTQPLTSSYRPARTPAAQDVRTPSPNYFGLTIDPAQDYNSSGANSFAHAKGNWSPPGSHVRSTAAASPRVIPLDQNPEFAEFRRQTQSFGFPSARLSGFSMGPPPLGSSKIVGVKSAANGHGDGSQTTTARSAANLTSMLSPTSPRAPSSSTPQYFNQPKTTNNNNIALPSPKQRSPKRFLPSPELGILDRPRRNSPAGFNERDLENAPKFDLHLPQEAARMSLPPTQKSVAPPPLQRNQRSETLPITLGDSDPATTDGPAMVTSQHVVSLLEQDSENILLLDLRVSTQYAKSRITGALNLCIPTTLLKRPAYNLGRLADTFSHNEEQKQKFEKWRNCQYIIVYDEKSGKMTDAQSSQNTLKKFANEGWKGAQYVIRGGFNEFASRFPHLLAKNSANGAAPGSQDANEVAPVIGGCPMPASTTKTAANPFFGNIRQNMDLIGGVGQLAVKQPDNLTKQQQASVPAWLSEATESTDNGKKISDKFFQIEKREQKRMQEALSGQVHYGDSPGKADKPKGVQLAGIEKGSKNRYNNIWSYEHSRVKLECSGDSCDYVNANYMHSSRSNKRYIGTQAPIPATFNDFWNVVWQQDVRVIVMLTAEKEGGQIKAHDYWSDKQYGQCKVQFHSEHRASLELSRIKAHRANSRPHIPGRASTTTRSSIAPNTGSSAKTPGPTKQDSFFFPTSTDEKKVDTTNNTSTDRPFVIVRHFTLSHSAEPFAPIREITQLQYTNWPDFGAPAHPAHLLGLVEQTDAVVRASYGSVDSPDLPEPHPNARPVIVHCSAGCGRTGTFCTVDSVIDMMKRQRAHRGKKRYADGSFVRKPEDDGANGDALSRDGSNTSTSEEMDVSPGTSIADSHDHREGSGSNSFDWGTPQDTASANAPSPPTGDDSSSIHQPKNDMQANKASLSHVQDKADGQGDVTMKTVADDWLESDSYDLIEQTVEEFRLQRLSAVQSLRQFVLCYESVLEWLAGQGDKD